MSSVQVPVAVRSVPSSNVPRCSGSQPTNSTDRQAEVRGTLSTSANGSSFNRINAGNEIALDPRVQSPTTVVVVRDAIAIRIQEIQVRIGFFGLQFDADPTAFLNGELIVVSVTVEMETRIAVLGSPSPVSL